MKYLTKWGYVVFAGIFTEMWPAAAVPGVHRDRGSESTHVHGLHQRTRGEGETGARPRANQQGTFLLQLQFKPECVVFYTRVFFYFYSNGLPNAYMEKKKNKVIDKNSYWADCTLKVDMKLNYFLLTSLIK